MIIIFNYYFTILMGWLTKLYPPRCNNSSFPALLSLAVDNWSDRYGGKYDEMWDYWQWEIKKVGTVDGNKHDNISSYEVVLWLLTLLLGLPMYVFIINTAK